MNTPSKEALEAAKELFPDAISFYRFVAENAAEIAELKKQEAESRRLFYAEQDKRQSAEYRCEELAGALRNAAKFARSMEQLAYRGIEEIDDEECVSIACRAEDALARHAAGEPAKHPDTEPVRRFRIGLCQKCGEFLEHGHECDAARKEVQP